MSCGKTHNVFDMEIELFKYGKINIGTKKDAIKTFGKDVSRGVTSPATSKLFNVAEGEGKLSEEKAATFHSTVEKLLWIMKRTRPDIETTISFI